MCIRISYAEPEYAWRLMVENFNISYTFRYLATDWRTEESWLDSQQEQKIFSLFLSGWNVKLSTNIYIAPRLRMSGDIPSLCHIP